MFWGFIWWFQLDKSLAAGTAVTMTIHFWSSSGDYSCLTYLSHSPLPSMLCKCPFLDTNGLLCYPPYFCSLSNNSTMWSPEMQQETTRRQESAACNYNMIKFNQKSDSSSFLKHWGKPLCGVHFFHHQIWLPSCK